MIKEELIEWIKGCIEYSVDEYNTQTNINNKAEAFGFLAELEKENAELKDKLNNLASVAEVRLANWQKLEKENAELKGEANSVLDNWCRGDDPCPHLKKRDNQLTKAKELLNKWVELFKPKGSNIPPTPIQIATEQFLSEVEK